MLYRRGGDHKKMNEVTITNWPEPITKLYDAITSQYVYGYSITDVTDMLLKLGQIIAAAGTLFTVTLIAWSLVRHFMEAREVQDYE